MGWVQYAIGGNMEPSLKSQSNLFIAPTRGKKEVIISIIHILNFYECVIYKMVAICYIN
jgi:hypothetical protein